MQKAKYYITTFLLAIVFTINAQVPTGPEIAWQRCYGTSGYDFFTDAITTSDGGFAAYVVYGAADGDYLDTLQAYGRLMKFDSAMNIVWQKSVANLAFEQILEVSDGYVLCGATLADTGIASGNHGHADILLVKTDLNGNFLWSRCYGSRGVETFTSFLELTNGDYLITGASYSSGGDIPYNHGSGFTTDAIIIKTNNSGDIYWVKVIGGSDYEFPIGNSLILNDSVTQIQIYGASYDFDFMDCETEDLKKRMIINIDTSGNILKQNCISAEDDLLDFGGTVIHYKNKTLVGSVGNASSELYPAPSGHLLREGVIALLDTNLILNSMYQYGGSKNDIAYKIINDSEDNFYLFGVSNSNDYDLPENYNAGEEDDYWLFAIDSNFNLLWSKNFGGSNPNGEYTYKVTPSPGIILYANNFLYFFGQCQVPDVLPDYDIACGHINPDLDDDTDAWLVAFDLSTVRIDTPIIKNNFSVYPNPAENTIYVLSNMLDFNAFTFAIYNTLGQILLETSLINNEKNIINIQTLPSGLYVAAFLKDGVIIQSEKIILQ
ncbi:MAG: T9SS type A sorting domain-containing protein [Bacteroidetes bacterium]|nr:T9SS type A sorting domain-containing protein [Bacteroidota bacterium]